jgi:hypothetical protein
MECNYADLDRGNGAAAGKSDSKRRVALEDDYYKAMGSYNFSLFTVEDYKQYKSMLLSMPYDWKLMKFFHHEYLKENSAKNKLRYAKVAFISFDEAENFIDQRDDPLENMLRQQENDAIWQAITGSISEETLERVVKFKVGKSTQKRIAQQEGTNITSVHRSIARALPKITCEAEKLLKDNKLPGFIRRAEKEEDDE